MINHKKPFKKSLNPLDEKFKKREGKDKYGRVYLYNGDIEKPSAPVFMFALNEKETLLLKTLEETYPFVFNPLDPKPLKEGIRADLLTDLKHRNIPVTSRALNRVLTKWTGNPSYKKSVIQQSFRVDLNNQNTTLIPKEQKEVALKALQFFQQQFEWTQYKKQKDAEKAKKKAFQAKGSFKKPFKKSFKESFSKMR